MSNKLMEWKKKQPRLTTNELAFLLDITPGWASTLLNQEKPSRDRRCSYNLALRIQVLTKGEVSVSDMMSPKEEVKSVRRQIRERLKGYAAAAS
jgi:hypothetical protein